MLSARHFCHRAPNWIAAGIAASGALLGTTDASAHPHVTVSHRATVAFEKGGVAAINHVWFFDEFYSAMAVEGLDTNKDGKFSREELAELTKTNAEGLKDFDYFTFPTRGGQPLKLGAPATGDFWSEVKDGQLALHFRVPLAEPLADPSGFQFSVYDPSYFIAFDFVKQNPVDLAGAPAGCTADVAVPKQEADGAKKLSESFFEQLGGGNASLSLGKTVTLTCGK